MTEPNPGTPTLPESAVADVYDEYLHNLNGSEASSASGAPSGTTGSVTTSSDSDAEIPATYARRARYWEEKGAAKIVHRERDSATGQVVTRVVRKSVRDFEMETELGEGSYSTVMLGKDRQTGKAYAVKVLDKHHIVRENKVKYVNIEKNALSRLSSGTGIVHLYYTFQDERSLYFVLQYASNGELLSLIRKHGSLSMDATQYYAAQLIDAIDYMHSRGVIHRDIKPENILISAEGHVLVTDFGTAKIFDKDDTGHFPRNVRASSFVGTAEYVSPELLNDKYCGAPADVWAFGCIVYQMIAGKPPFKAGNEYQTFQKVTKLQYAFTAGFPTVVRDLVKRILVRNPQNRLTVREVKRHYFFREVDFAKVWETDPPDPVGPYKMTAQAMMPVPALDKPMKRRSAPQQQQQSSQSSQSQQSQQLQQPPRSTSQLGITKLASNGLPLNSSSSSSSLAVMSAVSAPMAAQAALSGVRTVTKTTTTTTTTKKTTTNKAKSKRSQNRPARHVPRHSRNSSVASSARSDLIPGTNIPRPKLNTRLTYRSTHSRQSSVTKSLPSDLSNTSLPSPLPMSSLDLTWVEFFNNRDERVLKAGLVEVCKYSTPEFERRFKGMMAESPLGYRSREADTGESPEVSDAITFNEADEDTDSPTAEPATTITSTPTTSKLRNFFSSKVSTAFSAVYSDPPLKTRVMVVTTFGRALLFLQNHDRTRPRYEKTAEIDLTDSHVRFVEVIGDKRPRKDAGLSLRTACFAIISSKVTLAFEVARQEVALWTTQLVASRRTEKERRILARDSSSPSTEHSSSSSGSPASPVAQSRRARRRPPPPPPPRRSAANQPNFTHPETLDPRRSVSDNTLIRAAISKVIAEPAARQTVTTTTNTTHTTRPITNVNSRMLARSRNR